MCIKSDMVQKEYIYMRTQTKMVQKLGQEGYKRSSNQEN